jgi:hypothetical protein
MKEMYIIALTRPDDNHTGRNLAQIAYLVLSLLLLSCQTTCQKEKRQRRMTVTGLSMPPSSSDVDSFLD